MISSRYGALTAHFRKALRFSSVIVAVTVLSAPLAAQDTLIVGPHPTCDKCEIQVDRIGTLRRSEGDSLLPAYPRSVAAIWDTAIIVTYLWGDHSPFIYDSTGRLRRRLTRPDGSPFRQITDAVRGPGDTLFLHEWQDSTIVLSPGGRLIRKEIWDVPFLSRTVVMGDGSIIGAGIERTPNEAGLPLHRVDRYGRHLSSFGADANAYETGNDALLHRAVTRAINPSRLWSAHFYDYSIELWGLDGRLHRILIAQRPWFIPSLTQRPALVSRTTPPHPAIEAISQDTQGLLWVLISVPSPRWSQRISETSADAQAKTLNIDAAIETVVEVVEPRSGTLIATVRVPVALKAFIDQDRILSTRQIAGGRIGTVWRVRLRRRAR